MPDSTSTKLSFLAGLIGALVLVPLVALAATTSPAAVQDGATFNATSGPEVTAGENMNVATNDVFPNSETVRLGPVTVSHAGQIETNLTGGDTNLPTIRPQASPSSDLTLAHDNTSLSASVTGGSIDSLALSDAATVGDSTRDIELDTGGTGTTLTVSGLTTSQVTFIDTSGSQNQALATTSVSNGAASLSVSANVQRDILLATSPPGFDVTIDSTNSSIIEGQTLTVTATVNNTGGAQGTQTVTLDAGPLGTNSTSVTLASGASQTVTLSLGTSTGDAGTFTATVASDDDSDSAQVTVLENVPNFTVNVTNSNAPISPGGTLAFDIVVENVGAKSDTQPIEVRTGGTLVETTPTTLASGATTTIPVSIDSSQTAVGATATVSSDNESETFVARESAWSQVNKKDTGSRGPVAVSPNGSLVAHASGSNVIVYESQSEAPVQNISVASNGVSALDWHPDGDRLAIGTSGNNLHVFDRDGNTLLDTLNYGGTVEDVEWSPDGGKLLVASRGGTAYVLDAASRGQLRTESLGSVFSVAWSGDGQRFGIGGKTDVRVYEVGGGRIFDAQTDLPAFSDVEVRGLAFARNGSRVVSVEHGVITLPTGAKETLVHISLHNVATGAQLDQLSSSRVAPAKPADAVADPTDDRVAVVSPLLSTRVYTIGTGNLTETESFGGRAGSADWAHSGRYIADSADASNEGTTWRVHTTLPVVDGTVTDSTGAAVANATLTLSQGGTVLDSAPGESNGEYTLVPSAPGTYTVTARFVGSSSAVIDSKTVTVPVGGISVPFTLGLVEQGIAGQIVDGDGNPVTNSTIEVVGQSSKDTTANGRFVLSTTDGDIDLRADAPDFAPATTTVTVPNGSIATVTIQLQQQSGFPISGQVVDLNGDPIQGANIFAASSAASTGPGGQYQVAVNQSGPVTVTASTAVDSATQTANATGGASNVDFVLGTRGGGGGGGGGGNLILRDEQTGEILNNRTVTVQFSNPVETSVRNTTTGIIDMTGLPLSDPVVASGETPGYAARRIRITDTDRDRNLFLLDLSNASVVLSEFELDDRTGEFTGPDTNSTLQVRRPMPLPGETDNIPWRVLLSDYVGAGDTVGMLMEVDERYRLRVRSEDGNVREVGNYVPVRNKTVPLTIGELTWDLGDGTQNVSWDASQVNRSGAELIRFQYLDRATETTGLRLVIHETGNQSREIYNQSFAGPLSNVTVIEPIPAPAANVTSWTVRYNASRGNGTVSAEVVVGPKKFPVDADSDWIPIFSALFLLFLSGFFSTKVANLGAIIVPSVATGLWAMGWLPVPLTWVLAALALGVGAEFAARGGFSDR